MTHIGFLHVREPGFSAGGAELRSRALYEAVHLGWKESSLALIPGRRLPPWAPDRLLAAGKGVPLRLTQLASRDTLRRVDRAMSGSDITVACTTFTASVVKPDRYGQVILDAHNLEWRVVDQLARTTPGAVRRLGYRATSRWTQRFEAQLGRRVAGVWAASSYEAEWFAAQGARVWVVPNGVEIPCEVDSPAASCAQLLFVGSLNSVFNRHGIEWFLAEVWPKIRREVPDARLAIIGTGPALTLPAGATQLGHVDELGPHYAAARACIAPLLSGAGTRLKVLEAVSYGRPVVSTSVGSEGLDIAEDRGVLLRDDADTFAEACTALLRDPGMAADIGRQARIEAEDHSWERISQVALDSLRELSQP